MTFDTSTISGGDYFLEFQLTDGDGVLGSSVTLTNFTFGGGTAYLSVGPLPLGSYSGDPAAGLTLDDSAGLTDILWGFRAGTSITFDLATSWSSTSGDPLSWSPDRFNFLILQTDGITPLSTTDPSGLNLLATAEATGAPEVFELDAAPVPEPSTVLLLAAGIAATGVFSSRFRRS
jgi:hypothetical protein